ncbi:peptidyl-prolyl cis-trans isomerase [Geovibrio ferrireducens]|uniref:peptidyl-prolyl cis-trans isomerase n=1 Tax=Geovibrio ferrireducens TaxID=46201 RepID=UPI002246D7A3|nr:peptidyl-prolyl cis-trans isomerase [Geovibrio ferrireducens]
MMKKTAILLILTAFLFGCGDNGKKTSADKRPKAEKRTILKINGAEIDNSELLDYAYFTVLEMDPLTVENQDVKDRIVRNFIIHRLLLDEAKKRGLDIGDERSAKIAGYIDKMEEGRAAENGDNETDEVLKNRLKKQMVENVLVQKMLTQVADTNVQVTDDELKAYYEENKTRFNGKRTANVFMILTIEEEKAKEAMAQLKKGVPFAEVAEEYSISDEKKNGGNLGWISMDDYPEVFAEAFRLRAGETSGIIKSEYGFHIFRTVAYRDGENKRFDQVKSEIYARLYSQKQEESVRNFIDEIYGKAEIINVAPASFEPLTAGSGAGN